MTTTFHTLTNPLKATVKFTVNVLASVGVALGVVLLLAIAFPEFSGLLEDYAGYLILGSK